MKLSHVMRKAGFAHAKTKMQISTEVTAQLISAFVFITRIVLLLFFLNPKFQASRPFLFCDCTPFSVTVRLFL